MKLFLAGKNHLASASRTMYFANYFWNMPYHPTWPRCWAPFFWAIVPLFLFVTRCMLSVPQALHAPEIFGVFSICWWYSPPVIIGPGSLWCPCLGGEPQNHFFVCCPWSPAGVWTVPSGVPSPHLTPCSGPPQLRHYQSPLFIVFPPPAPKTDRLSGNNKYTHWERNWSYAINWLLILVWLFLISI